MVIIIFSHKSGGVNSTFSYYLSVLSRIINSRHFERRYFMRAYSGEEDEGWRLFRCSTTYDKTLRAHVNRHNVVKYEFQKQNESNELESSVFPERNLIGNDDIIKIKNFARLSCLSLLGRRSELSWYENEYCITTNRRVMYFFVCFRY